MVVTGGVESKGGAGSIAMLCVRTGSTFPTASHARKATVAVAVSLNGPVYWGLDVVGVVPSVV